MIRRWPPCTLMAATNSVAVEDLLQLGAETRLLLTHVLSVLLLVLVRSVGEDRAVSGGGDDIRIIGLGGRDGHSVELRHCELLLVDDALTWKIAASFIFSW